MAIPANPDGTVGEGALHFFARESQTIVRWIVYALLVVTVLTMITFFFWAIIPATILILAYVVLMVTNVIERRSDRRVTTVPSPADASAAPRSADSAEPSTLDFLDDDVLDDESDGAPKDLWSMSLIKHETLVVSLGILAVLVLAIVMAAIKFGGAALVVAVFFLFAYMVLLTTPVWMAALEDDIEEETHRREQAEDAVEDAIEGAVEGAVKG